MELIRIKDVLKLDELKKMQSKNISTFLSKKGIKPVKRDDKNNYYYLYNKNEILEYFRNNPYITREELKDHYLNGKDVDLMPASIIVEKLGIELPKTASTHFTTWAKEHGIKPKKQIKKFNNGKSIVNLYSLQEIKVFLSLKKEQSIKSPSKKKPKKEPIHLSDCCWYLKKCLPEAAIKNRNFDCSKCQRYNVKEFNYYESTY